MATPLLVQWAASQSTGTRMSHTKLVECPVVDRTPLLSVVLYSVAGAEATVTSVDVPTLYLESFCILRVLI